MKEYSKKQKLIICLFGIIPVIWFALLIAPYIDKGLAEIIKQLGKILNRPFSISLCSNSIKTVFFSC